MQKLTRSFIVALTVAFAILAARGDVLGQKTPSLNARAKESQLQVDHAAKHTEWVAKSLREMQTVKAGMTRTDLLKVFVEEGGLSTPTSQTFAYRDCPYIKVDVTFELKPADRPDGAKIATISKPYLAWAIAD